VFSPRDLQACVAHLEATYAFRLFAQFEGTLRNYWLTVKKKATKVQTEALIAAVAARNNVPTDVLLEAQAVRAYRNNVVHHGSTRSEIPLGDCKSRLARFLSWLPRTW
jgi:hypothetical protein